MNIIQKLEALKYSWTCDENAMVDDCIRIVKELLDSQEFEDHLAITITKKCGFTHNMGKSAAKAVLSALRGGE